MLYPKIRELRILHDYKQDYVANALGMSQPEYSRMENGHRHARIEDLRKLSTMYSVSLSALLLREPEGQYQPRPSGRAANYHSQMQVTALLAQQEEMIAHLPEKQHQTEEFLKEIMQSMGKETKPASRKDRRT